MTDAPAPPPPSQQHWRLLAGGILAVGLVVGTLLILLPSRYVESTDDAYVEAHLISVVAKVPAYVERLHVDDNTKVAPGDLLVELDARDYQVQVDLARTNLAVAEGKLQESQRQIVVAETVTQQARAELQIAEANNVLAAANLQRLRSVSDIRAVSTERLDTGKAAEAASHATVTAARVKIQQASAAADLTRAQAETARNSVAQAQAILAQATLNLSYTKIFATEAGSVAHRTVEAGNFVQPGQILFSVVPAQLYVIANFKETQLAHVRPGQEVTVTVDALPALRLKGHVDSLQRGTGSIFALLPPENATGNFVKVVQRVPIKILLDDPGEACAGSPPACRSRPASTSPNRRRGFGFSTDACRPPCSVLSSGRLHGRPRLSPADTRTTGGLWPWTGGGATTPGKAG